MLDAHEGSQNNSGTAIRFGILIVLILMILATTALAFFSARAQSRDRIRVADINILTKFLTAYKQSQGNYPQANTYNQPLSWEAYLTSLPQSPQPADGNCAETNNKYSYSTANQNQGYQIIFCLGNSIPGFNSGLNTIRTQ